MFFMIIHLENRGKLQKTELPSQKLVEKVFFINFTQDAITSYYQFLLLHSRYISK